MLGGAREHVRRQDVDLGLIFQEGLRVKGRDLQRRLALFARRRDHLVLAAIQQLLPHVAYVGDILDVFHLVTEAHQRPADPIRQHK